MTVAVSVLLVWSVRVTLKQYDIMDDVLVLERCSWYCWIWDHILRRMHMSEMSQCSHRRLFFDTKRCLRKLQIIT